MFNVPIAHLRYKFHKPYGNTSHLPLARHWDKLLYRLTKMNIMKRTTTYRIANIGMVAAFSVFGLVACNSDDYKTENASTSELKKDTVTRPDAVAADNTADGNTVKDNAAAAKSSTAATPKKRKASIAWPADNSDKMIMDKEGVYNKATVMPEFPGGQTALSNYVNNHLDYTQQAIDDNTTGIVRVSFVIDENGKVTGAHLIDGGKIGNGLDEQALKVVGNMPLWKPGKVHGKNVKTRLELPINFQLEA